MNKLACLLGTVASGATLFAGTIYVTPSGGGDGTGWGSPTTLSAAVGAAGDGDEIWLAAGDYALTETLTTDKAVALIGGFAGEASADETTGELVTFRRQESPAIDAGDPAADFSREPVQRDGRLNLGCWGNTPWATRRFDAPGVLLFIR